jgi:hypothetical protein
MRQLKMGRKCFRLFLHFKAKTTKIRMNCMMEGGHLNAGNRCN